MILTIIILIISLVVNLGLGLLIFTRSSHFYRKIYLIFGFLCISSALWIFSVLMVFVSKEIGWKLFWVRMVFGITSFIPAIFLNFSLIFPSYRYTVNSAPKILIYLPPLFFLAICQTDLIAMSFVQIEPYIVEYGIMHNLFSVYLIAYLGIGFYFLLKTHKNSTGVYRLQITYCFLGMLITSIGGLFTNVLLPILGTSKYSAIGPSFTMIMVGFTTYSILKHRLMDINIVLKKGTTYVLLLLLLFVPSFLLILFGQKIFYEKINYFFTGMMFLILFIVAILFHRIKPETEKAVEHLLFKDRYDYRETLGKFSKAMVSILDLHSLSKRIIETITQTMGVQKASFFLMNDEKRTYDLFESKNLKLVSPLLLRESPLPHYLQKIGEIVVREELAKGANIQELKEVIEQMALVEAEVSIPLISKNELIGILNLSYKLNKDIYSQEDIELLTTLANQTAIAIENARLYEDLRKSKSYIRRADRLASLGTLTAGLAHEIRNPLVAIKTLTQLLPERLHDEEFRSHFLNIAAGEVDRISRLVNELLDFARPSNPKLEFEEINTILDGMILLVTTESKKKSIQIAKQYTQDLPSVKVDREQIKQVFLNILLNAIEATPEYGEITVKTRSFLKPGGEPYLQVEFKDTGCGIPKEHLEEIFNPFYTTKTSGSGLGLSISNQIVQDHKGYIDVESSLNQGTSFFVNLPVDQDHPRRRQSDSEQQLTTYFEPR
ncbi:MAG: GAF domain-containing protein [Deltaproteobacteria bacterium]|nr:GAF domain-containing protein [Deltaproteobacteria bacterium]